MASKDHKDFIILTSFAEADYQIKLIGFAQFECYCMERVLSKRPKYTLLSLSTADL